MTPRERARLLPPAIAVFLLLLLAALATLQYRVIGRVSDLERQRMRENLRLYERGQPNRRPWRPDEVAIILPSPSSPTEASASPALR